MANGQQRVDSRGVQADPAVGHDACPGISFAQRARLLADEALSLLEGRLSGFTSAPRFLNRHVGAGFLTRCLALIRGIETLDDAGYDDLCGLLFRVLVECCLLGMYVVLGGEEAIKTVLGDHKRNLSIMARENDSESLRNWAAEWSVDEDFLKVQAVAQALDPLLRAAGDQNPDARGIYNSAYRLDSTFNVHGVGAVLRYLDVSQEPWRIQVRPEPLGMAPETYLNLGALYTTYFAGIAFNEWGYGADDIASLLVRLTELADLGSPVSPAGSERGPSL